MAKNNKKSLSVKRNLQITGYKGFFTGISELLESARRTSARTTNAIITATYWEVGRRIVEYEQKGKERASYGETLLKRLSNDLVKRFGRGFGLSNLKQIRKFYIVYKDIVKSHTMSGLLYEHDTEKGRTLSGQFTEKLQIVSDQLSVADIARNFPLPWTHPDENPPVGLILCAQKNSAVAHYALEGLPNKVLATEYRTALPDEKMLAKELERTRRLLERRNVDKEKKGKD